ncbi:MAG: hypothetical protein LIP09_11345 [Bacteroidales bacterium]|nr:hypothetical protein [Bacteroidales bacterium]
MPTNRENLHRLLRAEVPGLDLADDEAICALIVKDYEDYARLLTLEQEMTDHKADYARLLEMEKGYKKALKEAELKGRNAALKERISTALPTDGLPNLGSAAPPASRPQSYFDLARI